ncbi:unnamed protein product [Rotaria sp. Silwood2]|nr:unnamed protein product [Rotaria sp. Silwood2]CAF4198683.1 unnamed protein product [Rotaria sp. Silwood2]
MGQPMIELIDQKQVTTEICFPFIKALEQRFIDNKETTSQMMRAFFFSLAIQLEKYFKILKNFPHKVHRQMASFILIALQHRHQNENEQMPFEHIITIIL